MSAEIQRPLSQWQLLPFHLGAAIGPMGGGVFPVLFAILVGAFGVDRGTLSLAVPAYMIPYALVQLVSGGISDLTSRRASIVLGFGSYGAASFLTAFAPSFEMFVLAQILQGATNAFTTPLLMATLGDVVPGQRMGRTMGFFSTSNLAGSMIAPLIAGFVGDMNWRLAYIIVGAIAWILTLWYMAWFRRFGASVPRRRRGSSVVADMRRIVSTLGFQIVLIASLSFLANGSMRGAVFLFSEYLDEQWGTSVEMIGLILATYGLAGLLTGPFAGDVIDRLGVYKGIAVSMVGVALSLILLAIAPSPLLFALANFLLGVAGIHAWAALNMLAVRAVPAHRGTVSSIFGSAKFLAQGVSPLWFTPLYQFAGGRSIFVASAVMALLILLPLSALHRRQEAGQGATLQQTATD